MFMTSKDEEFSSIIYEDTSLILTQIILSDTSFPKCREWYILKTTQILQYEVIEICYS